MSKKNRADAAMAQGRLIYMLELARGSSHIASTRIPQTLERAITEVLDGFCQVHGLHTLEVFQELLALAVGQRGHREAALAVSAFGSTVDGRKAGPVRDRPGKARTIPGGRFRPAPERAVRVRRRNALGNCCRIANTA